MALNYYYNYAEIDTATGMCIGVHTLTSEVIGNPALVEIPAYDENYIMKYYINGSWYEDAAGTIPWESSLI